MSPFFVPSPQDNCAAATTKFLKLLKVKVSNNTVKRVILEHPNHPSLLSISDALERWHMNVLAATITYDQLIKAKTACIAQIKKDNEDYFITIKSCSPTEIQYYNELQEFVKQSKDDFIKIWTGVTLFAETTEASGEETYQQKARIRNSNIVLAILSSIAILVWIVTSIITIPDIQHSITAFSFVVISMLGLFVSIFLLWYEVDAYNPILQQLCTTGKKVNCGAVLNAKESKVLFGLFNWSEIGFAYFVTSLFLSLILGKEGDTIIFLGNLSLLSIPIILASFYYQVVKIKQFCLMCLIVQILLITNVSITLVTGYHGYGISVEPLAVFIGFFCISLWFWRMARPILLNAKQKINTQRNFNKLKNNPNVFLGLLQGSKKMTYNSGGLGITVGDDKAPYKVTKVCNPYCPPCAAAHPILEGLVHRGLVQLQVIFTSSPDIDNKRALPTRHLMALAAKNDKILIHKALDDWYLAKEKNYKSYAQQYPLNGGIAAQTDAIKAMRDWCDQEHVTHTPTIYINNHILPKEYTVDDLIDVLV
ncbi:vitamin K epoxide reductase family protein [Aquimarina sp. M1]